MFSHRVLQETLFFHHGFFFLSSFVCEISWIIRKSIQFKVWDGPFSGGDVRRFSQVKNDLRKICKNIFWTQEVSGKWFNFPRWFVRVLKKFFLSRVKVSITYKFCQEFQTRNCIQFFVCKKLTYSKLESFF